MPNTNCSPALVRFLQCENDKMVKALRAAIKNRKVRDDDYPKVTIACEYGQHKAFGHSLSCHSSIKAPVRYVRPLFQALSSYGTPPIVKHDIKAGCVQYIGTCAEDSAANQVMVKVNKSTGHFPKLKSLVFTEPMRARTHQRIPFCDVCDTVF